jgi:hypothetical protein
VVGSDFEVLTRATVVRVALDIFYAPLIIRPYTLHARKGPNFLLSYTTDDHESVLTTKLKIISGSVLAK